MKQTELSSTLQLALDSGDGMAVSGRILEAIGRHFTADTSLLSELSYADRAAFTLVAGVWHVEIREHVKKQKELLDWMKMKTVWNGATPAERKELLARIGIVGTYRQHIKYDWVDLPAVIRVELKPLLLEK